MGEDQHGGAAGAAAGAGGGAEEAPRPLEPGEFQAAEGRQVVAVDRDEFDLLPEYSHSIPTQSGEYGVKRWKAAIQGRWYLGKIVRQGEVLVLLAPTPIFSVKPADVAEQLDAFRDLLVLALPEPAREEFGRILDQALAMPRASAYAVAVGRGAVMRELQEERDSHGQTLDELSDAEEVLAAHGLMKELAAKRDARRRALPEGQRATNHVQPGVRRILEHAVRHEPADPGSLLRKVCELAGLEAPVQEEGCRCDEIQRADPTRHFKGCLLREKYPEPAGPVAGVTLEIHQDFTGQDLDRVAEVFQASLDQRLTAHRPGT